MRSWLGIIVAAVLVTGCGTAAAATSSSKVAASVGKAAALSGKAGALASHLVAEMTFPAGTKPASLSATPKALRDIGPPGSHWAHAERLLLAPVRPAAVWAVLLPHKPFRDGGTGGPAGQNGPVGTSVLLPAPEPGIAAAIAEVTLEPWHNGTTLIAAYGFATWLPVRTAAEHLNPRGFAAVTVTASTIVPHQRTVKRTFTSASVIAKIAAFLNPRPAAPQLALPCPMAPTSYRATFKPAGQGSPTVTASSSCLTDQITVKGVDQPLLWDTSDGLATLLGKLLGLVHAS